MRLKYIPSTDESVLIINPKSRGRARRAGSFKLWSDGEGGVSRLVIQNYRERLREFRRSLKGSQKGPGVMRLKGIWRGIKITEEDIQEAREERLKKIEERW